jgi:hypothetical protein
VCGPNSSSAVDPGLRREKAPLRGQRRESPRLCRGMRYSFRTGSCDVQEPSEPGQSSTRVGHRQNAGRSRGSFEGVSRTRSAVSTIASRKGRPISSPSLPLPGPPDRSLAADAQGEGRAHPRASAWRPGSSWRWVRSCATVSVKMRSTWPSSFSSKARGAQRERLAPAWPMDSCRRVASCRRRGVPLVAWPRDEMAYRAARCRGTS